MKGLNYHHLLYFRAVAHEGHLTRAAEKLNLSQSALSTQIKALEARLGHDLFRREGRSLHLTEVGQIALDYADQISGTGQDFLATLARRKEATTPLRVGAQSTLSRNFQMSFLHPALSSGTPVDLRSGSAARLLNDLAALSLDVVLTTEPPSAATAGTFEAHSIAAQPVELHGVPERMIHKTLAELLTNEPVILPTEVALRARFDALVAVYNVQPQIIAEVDDMAMVRLLAREGVGIALAPAVVLSDEILNGRIVTAPFKLDLIEAFYAVTVRRNFPHPALDNLLKTPLENKEGVPN